MPNDVWFVPFFAVSEETGTNVGCFNTEYGVVSK